MSKIPLTPPVKFSNVFKNIMLQTLTQILSIYKVTLTPLIKWGFNKPYNNLFTNKCSS